VIRVVVIAESAAARTGLNHLLEEAPEVEVLASLASWQQYHGVDPDVILAEWEGDAPLETFEPALVLLTEDAQEAIRAGARAVLSRRASPGQVVAALQAAATGLVVMEAASLDGLLPGHRPARQPAEPLTPREIEVLRQLADGESNKIVAYHLGISEHTVKFHVTSIMAKLNAGSRTEAVTMGIRQGLIPI
jgi:two-component system, NarL family, response regulator YdfI